MALMEFEDKPHEEVLSRFMIAQDTRPEVGRIAYQADLREVFANLADNINSSVADSREKSLAITHLEEALMWAGKAIFKD